MVVGISRVTLHLPGNQSLKGKRQVIRRICDRIRNRFHISVAEVGDQDMHQRSQIAYAVISNEQPMVESILDQVLNAIDALQLAPILNKESEILHFGEDMGEDPLHPNQAGSGWDYMEEWK